mgnify:CR=1 FL=1
MNSREVVMQQSQILAEFHEACRKTAIKHDRAMRIHNVVGIVLRVALIFSVAMAVIPKIFC